MIHPRNGTGRGQKLVEEEGPSDEGFILKVHLQPKGQVNSPGIPQTIKSPYWMTHLNVYPVGDLEKQIYIALSHRGRTDKKLIQKLQKIVEGFEG